jgi:voltage-gated potassium channel
MSQRAELWQRRFEWPIAIAALTVIPILIIEDSDAGGAWPAIGAVLNWCSWGVFLAEIVVMLSVVTDRRAWLLHHPLDVAIVVLTPPFVPLLGARLLRLLRVLRLLMGGVKLSRLLSLDGIRVAGVFVLTVVIAGGSAFAAVESQQGLSTWDGVWWAITTVTTVGYGEIGVESEAGRVIAVLIMFVGIGFVALVTAFIAERFVRRDVEGEAANVGAKEDRILAELQRLSAEVAALQAREDSPPGGERAE